MKVLILSLLFIISCGQRSEFLGPYDPVEYDDSLIELSASTVVPLTGKCEPGANLSFSGPVSGSPISAVCDQLGMFSTTVILTAPDGLKSILVTQNNPNGVVSTDDYDVVLDTGPPIAVNDSTPAATYGQSVVPYTVLSNDSDLGSGIDPSTLSIITPAPSADGTCSLGFGATTFIQFAPTPGFSGSSSCSYEICDALAQCSSAVVTFNVASGSPIEANDDVILGTQNFDASLNVLQNDSDPDGIQDIDLSSLSIITNANPSTEGTCAIGPGPSNITFSPNLNYFGTAICVYQICDFEGNCDSANASYIIPDITVPVPTKDTALIASGGPTATINVVNDPVAAVTPGWSSGLDTDPAGNLDLTSVTSLASVGGTCQVVPVGSPNIQFVPNVGFVGLGSCTYQICDTSGNCAQSIFEITVIDGQAPLAADDLASTDTNVATSPVNVSLNDIDPENRLDTSSITLTATPAVGGTCAISPSVPFIVFTPSTNFVGNGSCEYQICDLDANCSTALLKVQVFDTIAPVALDDLASTNQNTPVTHDVVTNGTPATSDDDVDNEGNLDPTSISLTGNSFGGTCSIHPATAGSVSTAAPSELLFDPDLNFAGSGYCEYRICDTFSNCSVATMNVTVSDITPPEVVILDQISISDSNDMTSNLPAVFQVTFNEPIDPATFTSADIKLFDSSDPAHSSGFPYVNGGFVSILNGGDNTNFTVQVSAVTSDGVIQIDVPLGGVNDANGLATIADGSVTATTLNNDIIYDGTAPAAPVFVAPFFTQDSTPDIDISCEPGSLIQISTTGISPDPYPAVGVLCPASGSVTLPAVPLPGGGLDGTYPITPIASDTVGNQTPGAQQNLVVDTVGPNIILVEQLAGQSDPNNSTNQTPIFFKIEFDEKIDPSSFDGSDILNTGPGGGIWTIANSGDDKTFTASVVALTAQGCIRPEVLAAGILDPAANANTVYTNANTGSTVADCQDADEMYYDAIAPGQPVIAGPLYTQDPTPDMIVNCDPGADIQVSIPAMTPDPYPAVGIVCPASGVVTVPNVPLPGGADGVYPITPIATDAVGNQNIGIVFNLTLDRVAPSVASINQLGADPTGSLPIFFEVVFSEPIDATTFTGSTISNVNATPAAGGVWTVTNSGDDQTFTISVSALTGSGFVEPSIQVAPAVIQDKAANDLVASTPTGDGVVEYDNIPPGIPVVTGPAFTNVASTNVLVACDIGSEISLAISGYPSSPVSAGTCTASPLSVPLTFPAVGVYTVTPTASDAVGNSISGAAFDVTYDNAGPNIISLQRLTSQPSSTNALPIFFEVIFDEAIDPTTFTLANINDSASTAGSGVWSIANSGDNTTFTISVNGLSADGTVEPMIAGAIADPAGNTLGTVTVGPNTNVVNYDGTAPGTPVVIDPAYTNSLTPTLTINCDIGSIVQAKIAGYNAGVEFPALGTAPTCSTGSVTIPLPSALPTPDTSYSVTAIASDSFGNQSFSAPFTMVHDQTPLSIASITNISPSATPFKTNTQPIIFEIVFSEPINATTFSASAGDITNNETTNPLGGGSWTIVDSGDGQTFTLSLNAITSDGIITPFLAAGVVDDLAGNTNLVQTVFASAEYDGTPPSVPVVISPDFTADTTPDIQVNCEVGSTVQVSIPGYTPDPFPAVAQACTSSPVTITLTTPLSDGTYPVTPISTDDVGNTTLGAAYDMVIDTAKPTILSINKLATQASPTNSEPVFFEVQFSEEINPSTFVGSDVDDNDNDPSVTTGVWSVTNTGDNINFIIAASAVAGDGYIRPRLLAAAVEDPTGNTSDPFPATATPIPNTDAVYFDNLAPTSPEILSWTWTLVNPLDGSISQVGTPQIDLTGAAVEDGGSVQIYDDNTCVSSQGSPQTIASGGVSVTDISYLTDGSADGQKVYYVRVMDAIGNVSTCTPIGLDYTLDTIAPSVAINQASTQLDPAKALPIVYDVVFSEPIDPATFTNVDILNGAGAVVTFSTITINNSGDDTNFSVLLTDPDVGGLVELEIPAAAVQDFAGNNSIASTSTDNIVDFACLPPDQITDLYTGTPSQTSVDLFWNHPYDNGCVILDYFMEYKKISDSSWTPVVDGTSTDPLYLVTGLDFNESYEFRVRAYNGLYGPWSNIDTANTKPNLPFFDDNEYILINLSEAIDSQCVALEDGTDLFLHSSVTGPGTLIASLNQGQTFRFCSDYTPPVAAGCFDERILKSTAPVFCAGRIGTANNHSGNNGNPPWVSPLWAEKELLYNSARSNTKKIFVWPFESGIDVFVREGATTHASALGVTANVPFVLTFSDPSDGSYRIESNGFVAATTVGPANGSNCCYDDMPALPKKNRLLGYPSNSGYLASVSPGNTTTIHHSNGVTQTATVSDNAYTVVTAQGSPTSLFRSEAVYVEGIDGLTGNNTADSNGFNSAPFAPISLMQRRYGINVLADYVAFASTTDANIKMIRPDGTVAVFQLARTGTGPFSLQSPYKYYLENVPAGTVFEGIGITDRFSVWYQPDTNTAAGRYDETIIYGFK